MNPRPITPSAAVDRGARRRRRPRAVLDRAVRRGLAIIVTLLAGLGAEAARAQTVEWIRQLGTTSGDQSYGVSADGLGNVYISGWTGGSLGGPSAGDYDAFVSKYDAAGVLQWTRQLGTTGLDQSRGVLADALGNVYITGFTEGSLGGPNAGQYDAFVAKYDAAGLLQWTRQLGTTSDDYSFGVSADGLGNVYIAGDTYGSLGGPNAGIYDAFVAKYDAGGVLQWTRQLGTNSQDSSYGVSADGLGNVYISGSTSGSLGGPNAGQYDAFVAKYDAAGSLQWTRQLGTTAYEAGRGVSADGLGNVYISGFTTGGLGGPNAGSNDVFIAKYDAAGDLQWTRQLGTASDDYSRGVSADGLGNVYIAGYTYGSLGGPNAGIYDAFVAKYDAAGGLQWIHQFGTTSTDLGASVSADGVGNVYISGWTTGSLGGPNAGDFDAFVAKLFDPDAVPNLPGDFNFDGVVDGADFLDWQRGESPAPLSAADLAAWKQHFGPPGTVAGAATVPEPSSLALIAALAAACQGRIRSLAKPPRRKATHRLCVPPLRLGAFARDHRSGQAPVPDLKP